MPVEAKPLFRPDVLRTHLAAFSMPGHVAAFRPKLAHWANLVSSGKANTFKEQEILPDFLTDFFCELLGYTRPADGGPRYTISREKHVQVEGEFADAVLGDFGRGAERFMVALEGKGPKDPLDRPFAGRRMSAVDQGYRYAINLPCDWVLVTSIRQTRLYGKGTDQQTYERFDTEELAENDAALKRFVFLLGAARVVPESGRCHFHALLAESERVGKDLTKEFYHHYSEMRQDAFQRLCRENPDVPRPDVLRCAQKLLDRVLFCAFCEDRGLLPPETIRKAYEHRDPYHPRPIWDNFRGLFGSINRGNAALAIHAYNGGLFAEDPVLDKLKVGDEVCAYFRELGDFDYRPAHQAAYAPSNGNSSLIDVDILGHIFEQSITDLEKLRNELDAPGSAGVPLRGVGVPPAEKQAGEKASETLTPQGKTRRKKEGAFYTPAFITRYIIEQALGGVLRDRFEQLRQTHEEAAKGTARAALADPNVYTLEKLKKPERAALVRFWEAWQDELAGVRLLDPACGSGAFLIEAFDQLHAANQASNDRLGELRGHRTLFDLDKRILENNLYGVDLNDEAIEICRLSLWIKTAERGKALTSLDHTIRVGNSIVADPAVHERAFDWRVAFPEVFAKGGFDVVVANPPYVRQELLSAIKPYLQSAYRAYHGMADLYVYFYELGLGLLKPGGLLSYVVTNKWMKSGYAEPLRRFFQESAWIESVVDFGHAKQIFVEADVFPSIIVARRPTEAQKPTTARLCSIPREQLRIDDLSRQIESEGVELPLAQLGADAWQLEPPGVSRLLAKIKAGRASLAEYVGTKPFVGIKTAYNEAFLIDTETRDRLVAADPTCAEVIKPYVRGQDVDRWVSDWGGLWMIVLKSSGDHAWPWSEAGDSAEDVFRRSYPSIYARCKPMEDALRKRQDKGRHWWELRSCAYWGEVEKPKIVYQEIQFHPGYALDTAGQYGNNKTFFIASADPYLLAVLNSPLAWWHNWRYLPHMKDEALSPVAFLMESLPIARPSDSIRGKAATAAGRLVEITRRQQQTRRQLLDWLRVEHEVEKPTLKLQSAIDLDGDAFVAEVKKVRGKKKPLSAAGLANLREEYARSIDPARALAAEALTLENELSHLVNEAYGLTPEEVAVMWETAPPRMPVAGPG
ncbi:MAG: Eco57I restriction-modification methylase domain-containing protein [Pirellulales bacterium]